MVPFEMCVPNVIKHPQVWSVPTSMVPQAKDPGLDMLLDGLVLRFLLHLRCGMEDKVRVSPREI